MLVLCLLPLGAQQLTPISNFMFNQQVYNPAAFGSNTSKINFSTFTRLQWSSIEGAPIQANFWGDYKLRNMAAGINLSTLTYSGYSSNDINLNYAYTINLTRKINLAAGIRAGITSNSFNTDKFTIWDQNDQTIANSQFQKTSPKLGAGFHLSGRKFYLGIASPDFFSNNKVSIEGDTAESFFKQNRNIALFSGYRIRLSDEYNLRPHVAIFYYRSYGMIAKLNTTFEIKDYFWAGLTYSTYGSASLLLGTHISSRIRFGYAFETQALFGARLNSHELNVLLTLDNLFRKKKD